MKMGIQAIINSIIEVEGGYVNNPDDKGGPTKYGITLKTLRTYKQTATINDIINLTKSDAYSIYENEYYKKPKINAIYDVSPYIAEEVLDTAINMGIETSIKFLQRALNALNNKQTHYQDLLVDGIIGENTINNLIAYKAKRGKDGELVLLKALNCLQGERYIALAEKREQNETFVYGWLKNRVII